MTNKYQPARSNSKPSEIPEDDATSTNGIEADTDASASSPDLSSSADESDSEVGAQTDTSLPTSKEELNAQSSLRDRLKTFLPQLAQANDSLQQTANPAAGGFELRHEDSEVEDEGYSSEAEDGPYIEMNLGLGVLEQAEDEQVNGEIKLPSVLQQRPKDSNKRTVGDLEQLEEEQGATEVLPDINSGKHPCDGRDASVKRSKIEVVDDNT